MFYFCLAYLQALSFPHAAFLGVHLTSYADDTHIVARSDQLFKCVAYSLSHISPISPNLPYLQSSAGHQTGFAFWGFLLGLPLSRRPLLQVDLTTSRAPRTTYSSSMARSVPCNSSSWSMCNAPHTSWGPLRSPWLCLNPLMRMTCAFNPQLRVLLK
jgi:hypothetical protein